MVDQSAPVLHASPVVQTAGLCKVFRDFWRRPRVEAVKDLDLQIRPGEVFGLLGPNGSGKTTTIKMLLGLLYPTRGRISVFGRAPTDVAVKERIGFLPEESYLYRFLVAGETLDYYGKLFRLPRRVRRDRTERLLDMVGLRHEARRPIGEYSKGMARRIGLAQALINDPEFLILDEPTSGLDPIGARQIKDVIRELGRKGKTILLSSHVLADVEDVCDRVTILYGGQQQAVGHIRDLLRERDVTQITVPALSQETIHQLRELIQRLEAKDILDVSSPRLKLEDFFLRIVREAQDANIQTYGAREGSAMPDFLTAPAETTPAEEVVQTLVSAGTRTEPVVPTDVLPDRPPADPSRELIAELMDGDGRTERGTDGSAESSGGSATPATSPQPSADMPDADRSVIDGLLHGPPTQSGSHEEPSQQEEHGS